MRLAVILTLGFGVWGPMLIEAEKIVFVVPRYIRRSYTSNTTPFYNEGERSYKSHPSTSVRSTRRPYFGGHYNANPFNSEQFFPGKNHRVPHGGDDFDQGFIAPNQEVNHVVIPHGKGISHGVSFGKGYIAHDEFKGINQNYEFPVGNGNHLGYAEQDHQGDVKFEDDGFQGFQDQKQGAGLRNMQDWPYASGEPGYSSVNYGQEANQDQEPRFEVQDTYKNQETSSASNEGFFVPKRTSVGESRAISGEDVSPPGMPANVLPSEAPISTPMTERKPILPIILHDTVDMTEYVAKMEAFAKSWPPTAALQGFGSKSQIFNPPGLTTSNYHGYNSWASTLPRVSSGSYQVQEDSAEEPSQRNFRTIMI